MLRILSIDGGDIREIIPDCLLVHLEDALKIHSKNPDASICDYFDLVAGTSTGAILNVLCLLPASKSSKNHATLLKIS